MPGVFDDPSAPAVPVAAPPPARGAGPFRAVDDIPATRRAVFEDVLAAAAALPPVANARHTLRLTDVEYAGPDAVSKAEHKRAVLRGDTLARRLVGTWRLEAADGTPVATRRATVARVPYLTDAGTYVLNGVDYTLAHQLRLRPGVFTRRRDNGEVEAHVNVLPGRGLSHRVLLDPDTGVLRLGVGQARLPLVPVLRALGATEQEMRAAWGNGLWVANATRDDPTAVDKLYRRLVRRGQHPDREGRAAAVRAALEAMPLDPEVTARTLGRPFAAVSKDQLLATTARVLAVHGGAADPDDRDSIAFQHLVGPEDLFAERMRHAHRVLRPLLMRASWRGSLDPLAGGVLTRHLEGAVTKSGLGQSLEEIGPADVLDQVTRVTRLGEGGIPSADSVPDESRSVQPSHFGYVDLLRTPESFSVGVDSRLATGARKGRDGAVYAPFRDPRTGETHYLTPQAVADKVVAFPGELATGRKHVYALHRGRIVPVRRAKVDLVVPDMDGTFNHLSNLVPLKAMTKGQRVMMGARMTAQALPLRAAEAPLVRTAMPGNPDRSFEEEYGVRMGAVVAAAPGVVTAVTPGGVTVRQEDGKTKEYELYDNHPLNRKSVSGDTRIVVSLRTGVWEGPISDYLPSTGDRVVSVDPDRRTSAWGTVTGYVRHVNDKRLYRVETRSGRSVVVTEDHSLVCMGPSGRLVPVYPMDCVVGLTRLPVATVPPDLHQANLPAGWAGWAAGAAAGLYLAEGHCQVVGGLTNIAVQADDRAGEVLSLFRSLGVKAYRNGGNVNFTSHPVREWLVNTFGRMSGGKFISGEVLGWPVEFRAGLVAGYMGGDGCLWADRNKAVQVVGVSTSRRLRDGLVDVLGSLGVFATLFDCPRTYIRKEWNDAYGFRVLSSHLDRLPGGRWFFYADRQAKLESFLKKKYRSSMFDGIPVPACNRKALYAELRDAGREVTSYILKTAGMGAVTRDRLVGLGGVYGRWAAGDVMWDPVTAVVPVPHQEWVYDLEVAGCEMFAVNGGLVVHNTYFHNTPAVRPGDRVAAGGLLARSNYTDGGGAAAVGVNLRTAYLPYRGYNFEDAVVVSASAARDKLESEHMYQHDVEWDAKVRRGKRAFVSLFPADFTRAQLDRLDADGVVRPGQTLEPGDPVVLVARERDRALNQVSRGKDASFSSDTLTWDHHAPGLVTDVERTKAGVVVTVKSYSPVQVGDKIAGRFGDKGVVGAVVPDDQMPRDAAGRPFEIVLNPLGVITRTNPSQIVEAALGKVARKTGRPVNVPDFKTDEDMVEYALRELGRHGLSDTEDVTDPVSGAKIPGVMTGDRFYMKLHHMAESKAQGRATGGYTNEDVPAKGGPSGSKRVSLMDLNALLSHGATESARDAKVVRGQKNLDLWAAFMQGKGMPEPQVPFVWRKFLAQLRAAGVHPVPAGRRLRLTALTDADVTALAGDRRLTTADTVDWKAGLKPLPGGLFDPTLTGGHGGTRWAAIALHEPMPNPVMEEPVRRILGLTRKGLEEVLAGRQELGGATGPAAVAAALGRVDLDRAVAAASAQVRTARGGARDAAVVRLRYLKDCRRLGLHPRDWVLSAAPVLPPAFRPVSVMAKSGLPMAADANYLYKDLFEANENLKHMAGAVDDVGAERLAVYNALKAVVGLGDPVNPKHQETGVKGVLKNVFGTSPKFGVVQRKLLGSTVDLVGRAVISPDPDLDMDEVAIPEGSAWEVYRPFVVRRLARAGVSPLEAARQTRDKTDRARTALLAEMGERPVVITRAPVLHRYGVMAFWPRLTAGNTMQVSPLIVKGFNADFDGDTMNFHVPASDGAVKDAVEKMLPSKNLLAVRNFRVHQVPANEFAGGLFHATSATDAARPEQVFRTMADLKEAFHDGRVNADTRVVVLED